MSISADHSAAAIKINNGKQIIVSNHIHNKQHCSLPERQFRHAIHSTILEPIPARLTNKKPQNCWNRRNATCSKRERCWFIHGCINVAHCANRKPVHKFTLCHSSLQNSIYLPPFWRYFNVSLRLLQFDHHLRS